MLKIRNIDFILQTKNIDKTINIHKFTFKWTNQLSLALVQIYVTPVCDFKAEAEVVHNIFFSLVREM